MRIRFTLLRPFFVGFLIVFMATLWVMFAPEPFGGQASYVMVAGASMEPSLHMGDLAIVRKARVYHIGDVVTYQHPFAGPIIHRIIDQEGDRYIFKGDHNDWIDSYHPSKEDFIGKLWLHLPNMGQVLQKIRTPLWLTLSSILIAAGIFSSFTRDREKGPVKTRIKRTASKNPLSAPFKDGLEGILFVLAALGFAAGILAWVSFSRPLTVTETRELLYELQGEFRYSAQAPSGIYDGEWIESGDPIYLQLTDHFDVFFQFDLISEQFSQFEGMIRLDAEISDPGGWRRLIVLHPTTSFSGKAPLMEGTIQLAELSSMIASLEERTGFDRPYYTLEIVASVITKAKYNGSEILDHFEPRLTFRMEEFQLYLTATEPNTLRLAQLEPQQTGFVQRDVEIENTLSILGLELPVRAGRWVSGIGLGIAILGFIGMAVLYVRATHDGEEARIAVKYGSMLVDIQEGNFVDGHHRVEVHAIEDLGRFAERVGGVILHESKENRHHYYVQEGEITYHYQTPIEEPGTTHPEDKTRVLMGEREEDLSDLSGENIETYHANEGDEIIPNEGKMDRDWRELPAKFLQKIRSITHSLRMKASVLRKGKGSSDEDG